MQRKLRLLLATALLLPLACSSSHDDDDVSDYRVTLEPEKTRALYRGLSGVWEVKLANGVGRLTLCETAPDNMYDGREAMRSSDTVSREVVLNHGRGGGMGCGAPSVASKDAVASWRGTWSTPRGTFNVFATYSAVENPYPEVYQLGFEVPYGYIDTLEQGWFRLDGSLRATSTSARGNETDESDADRVFHKVAEGTCDEAARDGGTDASKPDGGDAAIDAAADSSNDASAPDAADGG